MRFTAFVRLRPGGTDDGLMADEPPTVDEKLMEEALALASAPLQLDDE